MEIYYTLKAQSDLENLSRNAQERIAHKMRFYVSQKDPIKFAKKLIDSREGEFRFRVGDWRIFFDVKGNKIFILSIKHRSKAY
ncbi:MAG: type II toxin-antitoxin system RelE/ParE family toxin [Patescibacteria group bacterium]